MPRSEAKKIAKRYAKELKEKGYPYSALYLFGSRAKGKEHKWSDIDVAVISSKLRHNRNRNRFLLWSLRRNVDTRIEPHGFSPEDFKETADPLVYEIKKTGIRVA